MTPSRAQFRDPARYAAAVVSELASPLLRAYGTVRANRAATDPARWRRGLILGSGHIGDVLYRTCSLEQLARGLPLCTWSYLTTADGAEILRGNPAISHVLPLNRETAVDFVQPHSADSLRQHDFDVALCTDNIQHHRGLWLATQLGIPNRVAFAQKGFSGLATIPVITPRASWPAQIRAMINAVTGTTNMSGLRPSVYLDADDLMAARIEWNTLAYADASLTIAASVFSRQRLGAIAPSLFIALLRDVLDLCPGARILLTGTASEQSDLTAIARELGPRTLVRAGTLSLRGFAAFLALCDCFVGVDSGPRHLANAAGIPVFFVRNMAVPEIETGKYCDGEIDIAPPGQYLSDADAARSLKAVDFRRLASAIVTAAKQRHAALL